MGTNSFQLQGREVTKHFIETDLRKFHGSLALSSRSLQKQNTLWFGVFLALCHWLKKVY